MPRKYNSAETMERVITVSMKLFNEKGFDKTTMQDIIDASEISKGAIFNKFDTKEAIFETVMERQYEYVMQTMSGWLAELDGLNARDKLIGLIKRNMSDKEFVSANSKLATIGIVSQHLTLAHMKGNSKKVAPVIAEIIREGIADGSMATDFPDECADVFLQLMNFWSDPIIFECDLPTVRKRLNFIQHLMKVLGVDIVTDEIIGLTMGVTEYMLNEVSKNG
jgi:AcrR family transcriptional regulator